MTDWAGWGTSVGTLVLAGATFAAIRSSNRSARIAERALHAGLRPLLVVARRNDPDQEVQFADGRVFEASAQEPLFRPEPDAVYLAVPLRNAGSGIAHLLGYRLQADPAARVLADPLGPALHRRGAPPPALDDFSVQQRDLYIAAGEIGFWQAAIRDPASHLYAAIIEAHRTRGRVTIDLLYGDLEGGQPTISRFVLLPRASGAWRCDASHHWRELPPQHA
jgi:hypothetical protein